MCYVANVGDSRSILSTHNGKNQLDLSTDHKPLETEERKRIESNGGRIYQYTYTYVYIFIFKIIIFRS